MPTDSKTLSFCLEKFTPELYGEMWPILDAHYKEIAHYQDIPLSPDTIYYDTAQKIGILRVYTVREGSKLVGYSVFSVSKNPHYSTSLQAKQDILFLSKELRGGMNGFKFIKWCDEELEKEGVQVVYHHVKKSHNFGPVLERMGYELVDLIYGRRLD